MLEPNLYEELLLSWYHMHIVLRCCHIAYKLAFLNWWLLFQYITCWWLLMFLLRPSFLILCNTNIFESMLTPLLFYLYVDVRCVQIPRNMSSSCCELEDSLGAHLHFTLSLIIFSQSNTLICNTGNKASCFIFYWFNHWMMISWFLI